MRSPSELPLLRILHIKTLSAALSMLHSINYGTLSSCGSSGMGYCILKEKMATTTKSWMGPCLEETPGYVCAVTGAGTQTVRTSLGSAKQHTRAVHPPSSLHTPLVCRWGWRNCKGKQGMGAVGSGAAVSDRASAWAPWPRPSERPQDMDTDTIIKCNANLTAPLPCGARGSGARGERPQGYKRPQQAKEHTGTQDTTPTQPRACHSSASGETARFHWSKTSGAALGIALFYLLPGTGQVCKQDISVKLRQTGAFRQILKAFSLGYGLYSVVTTEHR